MTTLFAVLRSAGATGRLRERSAETIRAFRQAVDEDIRRRHTAAMLQALDEEVLRDLGIQGQEEEQSEPEAHRSELTALHTVFSWTRFAK